MGPERRPPEGAAAALRVLGRSGRLDPARLAVPLERIRSVAVTAESATSVVLAASFPGARQVPLGEDADAKLLIGDAALRSAFEDPTPHHDLGRIWTERTGLPMVFAVWACLDPAPDGVEELEDALVASVRRARSEPEVLAREAMERYGYPAGFLARYFEKLRYRFGPRERAALFTFLELARDAGELDRVPNLRFVYGEQCSSHDVRDPRQGAGRRADHRRGGARLLESKDLVAVGKAAEQLRARRTDPDRITFIIDRNVNYTNVCVTDCDFCAFYRRPGDRAEGYLLPKTVIQEDRGDARDRRHRRPHAGRAPPDLGIDYYEDLFRSLKARYPVHLHALSPPEIQHIARRSKLSSPPRSRASAMRASTRSPAAAPRSSSTACAT